MIGTSEFSQAELHEKSDQRVESTGGGAFESTAGGCSVTAGEQLGHRQKAIPQAVGRTHGRSGLVGFATFEQDTLPN